MDQVLSPLERGTEVEGVSVAVLGIDVLPEPRTAEAERQAEWKALREGAGDAEVVIAFLGHHVESVVKALQVAGIQEPGPQ